MSTPVLATKLFIPAPRPRVIPRPQLINRLNQGLELGHKLTLISAPAGFGKTTLASKWVLECERPATWVSLDQGDNDPSRFLAYLIAALQTVNLKDSGGIGVLVGQEALEMLQSPQPPSTESILISLLNEISTFPKSFILVLDDYHLIDAQAVDDILNFLLENLPPQMHLVIVTREDPFLQLPRLRARGQMTELRAADLLFSTSETAEFLNHTMGLDLSPAQVAALETRTEGWIAGLQLAAISMQGREDTASLVKSFAGSHRLVVDYLFEEVLSRQSPQIQDFLLQTAVLDRLSAPLCEAVTGQDNGQTTLEALDHANLFIIPLDDQREWYRYHHLFADLLKQKVCQTYPDRISTLHIRASEWYGQKNMTAEAIHHALAAEDFEHAAGLTELAWPAWRSPVQLITWLGWAESLPDDIVRLRPVLCAAYAQALLNVGKLEAAEAWLEDAERRLAAAIGETDAQSADMIIVDEAQFMALPVSLATTRAYHAQAVSDIAGTIKYTRRVLSLLPEEDNYFRGSVMMLLGLAYWASGDLEPALDKFSAGVARMQNSTGKTSSIDHVFVLAEIELALGHLQEAVKICENAVQLAEGEGDPLLHGVEDLYSCLSRLHCQQGRLDEAAQDLAISKDLGEQAKIPDWRYRWCIAQAQLKETLGDFDAAYELLNEAERLFVRTPLPNIRPIAALKAHVRIRQGKLVDAQGWAQAQNLSISDDLTYLQEFEHMTLARLFMAQHLQNQEGDLADKALGLLGRLLQSAKEGNRMGSVIEILVLMALGQKTKNNIHQALLPLESALTLAEPQGYLCIFVDEGAPMASLLYEALSLEIAPDYVRHLLAHFPMVESERKASSAMKTADSEYVEPLSAREIEVLQLIADGLTNQEVAARLFLSLHTIKVHARNIYGKLGVKNRTQAVAKGRALGILSPL